MLETVRKVADREIAPLAMELDEKSLFPEHARNLFAELGLLNPLLPTEYGGTEMDILTFVLVLEEIARVCASTALLLIAQTDGMLPIIHGGSPALKERFLHRFGGDSTAPDGVCRHGTLGRFGPARHENPCRAKGGPVRDQRSEVLHHQRLGGRHHLAVRLYGSRKEGQGHQRLCCGKRHPGLVYGRNEKKMGMRGSVNSELFFEDMKIPAENLIGAEGDGFANLMKALSMNRVFCAAQAVGIAQGRSTGPACARAGPVRQAHRRSGPHPVHDRGYGHGR